MYVCVCAYVCAFKCVRKKDSECVWERVERGMEGRESKRARKNLKERFICVT